MYISSRLWHEGKTLSATELGNTDCVPSLGTLFNHLSSRIQASPNSDDITYISCLWFVMVLFSIVGIVVYTPCIHLLLLAAQQLLIIEVTVIN